MSDPYGKCALREVFIFAVSHLFEVQNKKIEKLSTIFIKNG